MFEIYGDPQAVGVGQVHYIDFQSYLHSGVVPASGTAVLTSYPTGGTATITTGAPTAYVLPVTIGSPSLAGQYMVDVTATLSNASQMAARLIVQVYWTAARSTMQSLIASLRGMTEAGVSDYTVAGTRFWSDAQMQENIDRYQTIYDFHPLDSLAQRVGSTYQYKIFSTGISNWEASPVILNSDAGTISSGYTFDAARGVVTFTADQAGSARYISGTAYNLYAAARDVWRIKLGHYASAYDVVTDNHNLKRSQLMAQAQQMIAYYAGMALPYGGLIEIDRGDMNVT